MRTTKELYMWVHRQDGVRVHVPQWKRVDELAPEDPAVKQFATTLNTAVAGVYDRDWDASRDWPLLHLASISDRALTLYSKLLWTHPVLADTRDSAYFLHNGYPAIHTLVEWLWRYKWGRQYPNADDVGVSWLMNDLGFPLYRHFVFPNAVRWMSGVERSCHAVSLPGWYSNKKPKSVAEYVALATSHTMDDWMALPRGV